MNKIKKFRSQIIDFRFYIFDLITIIFSSIKNLLVFRKLYDNNVSIVSASDQHFADTLFQLLDNLHQFKDKYFQRIIIYNLGMKIDQIEYLKINFPNIIIQDLILINILILYLNEIPTELLVPMHGSLI